MKHRIRLVLVLAAATALAAAILTPLMTTVAAQADITVFGCLNKGGTGTEAHEIFSVSTVAHTCPTGSTPISWTVVSVGGSPSPSPSPSATSPSPSPSPTTPSPSPSATSPSPSPSPSATGTACVQPLGSNCGPYSYASIPMSNGFDTYVANQNVGANSSTTETVTVTDPGNWSMVSDALPLGYTGVQTFPDVQQLTNDWCGSGWGGCNSPTDTPLDSLSVLSVSYSETSPTGPNDIYEFAPDIWSANYNSDVMFWADTHGRCDPGAYGGTILGTAVLDGQTWTVNRYGGPGAEIIFVLDSNPSVPDSCANQAAGTIDIKAGFDWLTTNGFVTGPEVVTQVNTGWEITSADNASFAMTSYAITAHP